MKTIPLFCLPFLFYCTAEFPENFPVSLLMLRSNTAPPTASPASPASPEFVARTYVVGIELTGLQTDGLAIALNGESTIPPATDGNFAFTTELLDGAGYSVDIQTQPSDQVCALLDKAYGAIMATDVLLKLNCVTGVAYDGHIRKTPPVTAHPTIPYIETIAGSYPVAESGATDAAGLAARFNQPRGLAVDGEYLYIADSQNMTIRRMDLSSHAVSTLAGSPGRSGSSDGIGTEALFAGPHGLTTDGSNLYVTDIINHNIRRIVLTTGAVSTLAGPSNCAGSCSSGLADGQAATARFNAPGGITWTNNALYVTDAGNRIRKVDLTTGLVSTFAGNGEANSVDGIGLSAGFNNPKAVTTDGLRLYVADQNGHAVRRINLADVEVTTLAGNGIQSTVDGVGTYALLRTPYALTLDGFYLYVLEANGKSLRRINLNTNRVRTILRASAGYLDGAVFEAAICGVADCSQDIVSNGRYIYMSDRANNSIRRIGERIAAHYPFDGNIEDASGFENHGASPANPAFTTDRFDGVGAAYISNGVDVITAADTNLPAGFANRSACAWVNPDALPSSGDAYHFFMSYGKNTSHNAQKLGLSYTAGKQRIRYAAQNNGITYAFNTPLSVWNHYCSFYDGLEGGIYINGVQVKSSSRTWDTILDLAKIGSGLENDHTFRGAVDEIRYYDRSLTQTEFNALAENICSVVPLGLVRCYPLDGSPGDANPSAALQPGVLQGTGGVQNLPQSATDRFGNPIGAYRFDGTDDRIEALDAGLPSGAEARSVCVWANPANLSASYAILLGYGTKSSGQANGIFLRSTDVGYFGFGSDVSFSYAPAIGEWLHLCGTYDGTQATLFLNGVAVGSQSKSWNTILGEFRIGSQLGDVEFFQGLLDDVLLWDRALSAGEIEALYNYR